MVITLDKQIAHIRHEIEIVRDPYAVRVPGRDFGKVKDERALELIASFEAVLASLMELRRLKGANRR